MRIRRRFSQAPGEAKAGAKERVRGFWVFTF